MPPDVQRNLVLDWADGSYDFRLTWAACAELERKGNAGIQAIYERVMIGQAYLADVIEVIRMGRSLSANRRSWRDCSIDMLRGQRPGLSPRAGTLRRQFCTPSCRATNRHNPKKKRAGQRRSKRPDRSRSDPRELRDNGRAAQ
jgi:hypothetical protein